MSSPMRTSTRPLRNVIVRGAVCIGVLVALTPQPSIVQAASGSVGGSCSGSWSNSYGSTGGTSPRTRASTSTADTDCQSVQSAVCTNSSGTCTTSGGIASDTVVPLSATRDALGFFPRTFHVVNPNPGKTGGSTTPSCC